MITIYLLCTGMILLYLIFSYMLGDLFLSFTKSQETSLSYRIILGFFLFFLLFQADHLPATEIRIYSCGYRSSDLILGDFKRDRIENDDSST